MTFDSWANCSERSRLRSADGYWRAYRRKKKIKVCRCAVYPFPHRWKGGSCTGVQFDSRRKKVLR